MNDLQVLVDGYSLPDHLGFGQSMAPVMFKAEYYDGQWTAGALVPYGPIELYPAAKVLHYAQEVFEGMKAYWVDSEHPQLFRPLDNHQRFNRSAAYMCMPEVPQSLFMLAVSSLSKLCRGLIPRRSGSALYLRPFMFGTDADLSISTSTHYEFYVIASPSEIYHSGDMRVLVERGRSRTASGGMGASKTGGNYAASLQSVKGCVEQGYNQVLWLNSSVPGKIDELSGMNLFAVVDGELHTPELSGSILAGITRHSVIELAKKKGYRVEERSMDIDHLLSQVSSGACSEMFACGTAAVISPISVIGDQGIEYAFAQSPGPVAQFLYESLLGLQEGRVKDDFGWIVSLD